MSELREFIDNYDELLKEEFYLYGLSSKDFSPEDMKVALVYLMKYHVSAINDLNVLFNMFWGP